MLRGVVVWLWPGAVLLFAVWFTRTWEGTTWFSQAVPLYAPLVFGVGLLLAWRFSRSRVGAVLIGLAGLNYVAGPVSGDELTGSPWQAGCVLLVILVGALSVFKDRGMFSRLGFLQPAIVAASILGSWALWRVGSTGPIDWTWAAGGSDGLASWTGLSDVTVLAGATSLALTAGMGVFRRRPVEVGLFWSIFAILLALASGAGSVVSTAYLMTAGLILAIAVLETSHAMAFRDELTGLPGRRALWQAMDNVGRSYSVGMVDVDHFKRFNDRHGHDVGDQVLRLVGSRLDKITGGGKAFRYGGEEFTVVFPSKGRDDALQHLETLRKDIEERPFTLRRFGRRRTKPGSTKTKASQARRSTKASKPRKTAKASKPGKTRSSAGPTSGKAAKGRKTNRASRPRRNLSVTVSIGVAERSDKNPTAEAVVKAADRALYRAKKRGRNRVAR